MKKIILCTLLIGSVTLQGSSKNLKELSKELSKAELTLALNTFIKTAETHFKGIDARLENIEQEQIDQRDIIHSLTQTLNKIPAAYNDTELRNQLTTLQTRTEQPLPKAYDDTELRTLLDALKNRIANLEIAQKSEPTSNNKETLGKPLTINPRHLKYLIATLTTATTGYALFCTQSGKNARNSVFTKLGLNRIPRVTAN